MEQCLCLDTIGRFLPFLLLIQSFAYGREGSAHEKQNCLILFLASLFEVCRAVLATAAVLHITLVFPVIPFPPPLCFLKHLK